MNLSQFTHFTYSEIQYLPVLPLFHRYFDLLSSQFQTDNSLSNSIFNKACITYKILTASPDRYTSLDFFTLRKPNVLAGQEVAVERRDYCLIMDKRRKRRLEKKEEMNWQANLQSGWKNLPGLTYCSLLLLQDKFLGVSASSCQYFRIK